MKNKKLRLDLDIVLVVMMITNVMVLVYIGIGQTKINQFLALLALIRTIRLARRYQQVLFRWLVSLLFIFYLMCITLLSGQVDYVVLNLQLLMQPMAILIYLASLICYKKDKINKLFDALYPIFNIYYVINLIVMLHQISKGVFYDNISGLMGNYGTHRLTAFTSFLVMLNLNKIDGEKKKNIKIIEAIYVVFIIISSIAISAINDNTALYVFLPIVLLLYCIIQNKIQTRTIIRGLISVLLILLVIPILMRNEVIYDFVDRRVLLKINEFIRIFTGQEISEERFAYIKYALSNMSGYTTGVGIGIYRFQADPTLSSISYYLRNWGMSNMSSLIASGGLAFMFLYIALYSYIVSYKSYGKKAFVVFYVLFLLLFYYGQTATSTTMVICVWLVVYAMINQRA